MPVALRSDSIATVATANNLRIASLSIALYDYVITLPSEWRFYTSQPKPFRLRVGLVLFLLIRYISILVLVISNVGFFSDKFTERSCRHFYMAAPVLKVIQVMISQAILGLRTYNVSRRNPLVGWVILFGFTVVTGLEWFTNTNHRVLQSTNGNCTAANAHPQYRFSVWLFYTVAMIYDLITLGISSAYLFKYRPQSSGMAHFIRIMLYDGVACFVVLTGCNILNVILYRGANESIQSAGASLSYAVTWIMSQRILIHIQEASAGKHRTIITQNLQSFKDINDAIRGQAIVSHKSSRYDRGFTPDAEDREAGMDLADLNVQVRIEHSIVMNSDPRSGSSVDLYSSPKTKWDARPRT